MIARHDFLSARRRPAGFYNDLRVHHADILRGRTYAALTPLYEKSKPRPRKMKEWLGRLEQPAKPSRRMFNAPPPPSPAPSKGKRGKGEPNFRAALVYFLPPPPPRGKGQASRPLFEETGIGFLPKELSF